MAILDYLNHPAVRHRMPGVLNVSVLLLLTASLAQWTWLLFKPTLPQVITDTRATSGAAAGRFNIQPVLSANLFGQVSREQAGTRLDNLPISSLNLILSGVIASGLGGHALISVNGDPQEPFTVGEIITGSAVLHAVFPDRVVIRRNGVMESLLLEGADTAQPALQTGISPPPRQTASVRELGKNSFAVSRDNLNTQIRSPDFLSQISMAPLSSGGFLVRKIQPGSLYEDLGLRAGDVIRKINSDPVNNIDDVMRFYQQLSQAGQVQLEIVRAGRTDTLQYRLE